MTSERVAEETSWRGDVAAGVTAWAGEQPDPGALGGARERSERPRAAEAPPPEDVATAGPDADPESVARTILLDQLTGRARSRAELRGKLAAKQVPTEIAEALLDRFEEVGLVDDAAFARAWVESRQASKGLAPRALAQELRRKGVPEELVTEALAELDPDTQREAAAQLVRRRLRSLRSVDTATATRRLVGLLARKGYSSGLALAVVREQLAAMQAEEPDEPPE